MKERPIPFSAPMVIAILAGTKTQTRRVAPIVALKLTPHDNGMTTWGAHFSKPIRGVIGSHSGGKVTDTQARSIIASQFGPHGVPGDRLWVREAWRTDPRFDTWAPRDLDPTRAPIQYEAGPHADVLGGKLRPGMFMPRWASRILLEVVDVSVEKLQTISEADCRAEGCAGGHGSIADYPYSATPREHYAALWDSLHGAGSWDATDLFVWVTTFKRVQP